jgi:hypothetical protein
MTSTRSSLATASSTTKSLPSRLNLSQSTNVAAIASQKLDLASLISDPAVTGLNESDKFKMQIVGDCHMILRPPYRYTLMRKPPPLEVRVLRHDDNIDVQLSKLFDGVYALQLDREEAYGPLNVTVATNQKPRMKQTFEVDFGTPWLKVAGWKKAFQVVSDQMQRDLGEGQVKLRDGLERIRLRVQPTLEHAAARAKVEAAKLQQATKAQSLKVSAIVAANAQEWSRQASNAIATHAKLLSAQASKQSARAAETLRSRAGEAATATADYSGHVANRAMKTFTIARAQKQARILWVRWSAWEMRRAHRSVESENKGETRQAGCGRTGGCRQRKNRW